MNFLLCEFYIKLEAYCDSDWSSTLDSSGMVKSITWSSLITWHSTKQKVISRSTAEAELRAITDTTCEISWLNLLLTELQIPQTLPVVIHSDNQDALDIASDPVFHPKTKHFALDCHFVRQQVQSMLIHPRYLPSSSQLVDIFTKCLGHHAHWHLLSRLNVSQPPSIWGMSITRIWLINMPYHRTYHSHLSWSPRLLIITVFCNRICI